MSRNKRYALSVVFVLEDDRTVLRIGNRRYELEVENPEEIENMRAYLMTNGKRLGHKRGGMNREKTYDTEGRTNGTRTIQR